MHSERIFMEPSSNQLPDLSLGFKYNPTTELSLFPPSAATTLLGGHGSFTSDQEPPQNRNVSSSDVSALLRVQHAHNRNRCRSPTSPYFSSTVLATVTFTLTNMPNRSFPYPNFSGVTRFSEISLHSHHHPQSNNYRYGLGSLPHEAQIHGLMRSRSLHKLPRRRCTRAPRMRWTTALHARFVHAVELRGGLERATPKSVMELMDVKDLTLHHVKSHLQVLKVKKRSPDIKKRDPMSTRL